MSMVSKRAKEYLPQQIISNPQATTSFGNYNKHYTLYIERIESTK